MLNLYYSRINSIYIYKYIYMYVYVNINIYIKIWYIYIYKNIYIILYHYSVFRCRLHLLLCAFCLHNLRLPCRLATVTKAPWCLFGSWLFVVSDLWQKGNPRNIKEFHQYECHGAISNKFPVCFTLFTLCINFHSNLSYHLTVNLYNANSCICHQTFCT